LDAYILGWLHDPRCGGDVHIRWEEEKESKSIYEEAKKKALEKARL